MSYIRIFHFRKSGHPDKNKLKRLNISFFCFVGGKKAGEKSAKNLIVKPIGHFTQKIENA